MGKDLIKYTYNDREFRVIKKIDGSLWFIGKDSCEILDIAQHRDAISRLDADERGSEKVDTLGGPQEMLMISESGLYTLIFRSNKAEAKEFRRWVTHEVLPSLRKTGGYTIPGAHKSAKELLEVARSAEATTRSLQAHLKAGKTAGLNERESRLYANERVLEATGIDLFADMGVDMETMGMPNEALSFPALLAAMARTMVPGIEGKWVELGELIKLGENKWIEPFGIKWVNGSGGTPRNLAVWPRGLHDTFARYASDPAKSWTPGAVTDYLKAIPGARWGKTAPVMRMHRQVRRGVIIPAAQIPEALALSALPKTNGKEVARHDA